jgi:spore cortex formation protein SpoVR/YcgB (stage V sporulation)
MFKMLENPSKHMEIFIETEGLNHEIWNHDFDRKAMQYVAPQERRRIRLQCRALR